MTSLAPWGGGYGAFDPFEIDSWEMFDIGGEWSWDPPRRRHRHRDEASVVPTPVDWRETENAHIFTVDLPGVRKEEIKVEVEEGRILHISGERKKEEAQPGDTWHRSERRRGQFKRRFNLPKNANLDEIKCTLDQGVLTVVIPKKEKEQRASPNVRTYEVA